MKRGSVLIVRAKEETSHELVSFWGVTATHTLSFITVTVSVWHINFWYHEHNFRIFNSWWFMIQKSTCILAMHQRKQNQCLKTLWLSNKERIHIQFICVCLWCVCMCMYLEKILCVVSFECTTFQQFFKLFKFLRRLWEMYSHISKWFSKRLLGNGIRTISVPMFCHDWRNFKYITKGI